MTAVPERLVVLVADDEPNELTLIRRAFSRLGSAARLIEVADGDSAIEYLRGERRYADRMRWPVPRMLVLDQWMGGLSGADVLRWVRTDPRWETLPVILLVDSVSSLPTDLEAKFRAAGCVKGLSTRAFMHALEKAIGSALRLAWQPRSSANEPWLSRQDSPRLALHSRPECV